MSDKESHAAAIRRVLADYRRTAECLVRSPRERVLWEQLDADFARLRRLRLSDTAVERTVWSEFQQLHLMMMLEAVSASEDQIAELSYMVRSVLSPIYMMSADSTVPMLTGGRLPISGKTARIVAHEDVRAARAPEMSTRRRKSSRDVVPRSQHGEREDAAAKFEKRHLAARAPRVVAPGSKFSIIAFIDVAPASEGTSAPLAEIAIPENGLEITLEAMVEGKLKRLGPSCQQVLVRSGEKSAEVEIAMQATELGTAKAVLRARTHQAYLGDLDIIMLVAKEDAPDEQNVKSSIAASPSVARRATLTVNYSRNNRTYWFMLFGDATGVHRAEQVLDEDIDVLVPKLMAHANGLARGTSGYSATTVEAILGGIGADIWKRLLPDRIKAVLLACWREIDHLDIVSDDDMLPWELLYAFNNGGPAMGFISDEWLVTRWRFGQGAPGTVGTGPNAYVIPSNAPPSAQDEIEALSRIFPADATWRTVDELNSGLSRPGMGLLHIAAHHVVRYGDPAGSFISLDKQFPQAMLGPQLEGVLERRPLVFINACASAAPTVQWQGATSWASRFLIAGAGAFIGSNWEVRDGTAQVFAAEFYSQVQRQQPLGRAFQSARAKCGKPGDPTRFAYSFFGHPDAVFKGQRVGAS